jgi:hypothetical protein
MIIMPVAVHIRIMTSPAYDIHETCSLGREIFG